VSSEENMRSGYWSRWLLLLAGLAAMTGCAQLTGGTVHAPGGADSRLAAEQYTAQVRALATVWAKMPDGIEGASAPTVVAAPRERPLARPVQMSAIEGPADPPVTMTSGATTRRSLWDKQPWEVELDKVVRGICHGC
jgi:hypothetical protein